MSSLKKIEANRRNAQSSTGPRTPEGKAAVAGNSIPDTSQSSRSANTALIAITHGLRAKKALLYFESYADFDKICRDLTAEWLPETPTEANLIEQMATAQLKLVRLESNLSHAFYQSYVMKCAACEDEITDPDGTVKPPDFIVDREFKVQKLINGISQHIARVERAWHKALDTLQKLQDRRAKLAGRAPQPAEASKPAPEPAKTSEPYAATPPDIKNVEQSHPEGGTIPRKEGDRAQVSIAPGRSLLPDSQTAS